MKEHDTGERRHCGADPRLATLYTVTDSIQKTAADLIKNGKEKEAIDLLSTFGYETAVNLQTAI